MVEVTKTFLQSTCCETGRKATKIGGWLRDMKHLQATYPRMLSTLRLTRLAP